MDKIVRHTLPTKFDAAPFGTLCQVMAEDDARQLFVQLSDTEESHWEPIGSLLESAFADVLEDREFIDELLALARCVDCKSFINIAEILKKKYIE